MFAEDLSLDQNMLILYSRILEAMLYSKINISYLKERDPFFCIFLLKSLLQACIPRPIYHENGQIEMRK